MIRSHLTTTPAENTTTSRRIRPQVNQQSLNAEHVWPQESFKPQSTGHKTTKALYSSAEAEEAAQPKASEPIRPEVQKQIDQLSEMPIAGIVATTRSAPRVEYFVPKAPHTISAQAYGVDFERGKGDKLRVIVNCEGGPSHGSPVTPGETKNPYGHITLQKDPQAARGADVKLNRSEIKYFLESMYGRFNNPMTSAQADFNNQTISAAFAVYYKDGGQTQDVQSAHRQLAAALKPDQGNSEGWNLRG